MATAKTRDGKPRRLRRKKADLIVAKLVPKALEINANPGLLYSITEMRLFGSYLGRRQMLGDIDLAFKLEPRLPPDLIIEASIARSRRDGARSLVPFQRMIFGQTEVLRLLQDVSRFLALHDIRELKAHNKRGRLIFPVRK